MIGSKFDQIKEIKSDMIRLAGVERELRVKAAQLGKLKSEKSASLAQLKTARREKLTLIDRINKERDIHARVLGELQEEAENLNRTLDQHLSASGDIPVNLKTLKGQMAWPVAGKIISSFGKKKSRRFDTYTINNGVEISPSSSGEIAAVLDGEVVFSDYFRGYGNLMIIQHTRNFHTLYGHCEKFVKTKGDRIRKGEVIALAGSSGTTAAKTLYFEIRESLKPTDPLKWLRKK